MENILNIINFIRAAEPRDRRIDLAEPVREQIALLKKYNLKGTFLLQYDSMCRPDLVGLVKDLDPEQFELGLWLEMNQPHCEAAGIPWRGRPGFEWDWHAHCGFSVGYTPEERRKLVDVIMEKFESLFHRPVRSVGSWMIDADTLGYLADRYQIEFSCNCKDQWGTDGYTVWGGYWNQGYYPSRKNVFCPAQTPENSIPVPVFRMLGSDPVTQYDLGLSLEDGGDECQKVASLEPVYGCSGSDESWVKWFIRQNYRGGSLAFAYAQAGQENSFGWKAMKHGLETQFPLFAEEQAAGRLRVERAMDTGRFFRKNFESTPATAVSALEPFGERKAQSVWYNCARYRANVYSDEKGLRIRDLFLFRENYEERYLQTPCETEYLVYDNLPVIDGNRSTGHGILAGGWLTDASGENLPLRIQAVLEEGDSLTVETGVGSLRFSPEEVEITGETEFRLRYDPEREQNIRRTEGSHILLEHNGQNYALQTDCGTLTEENGFPVLKPTDSVLRFHAE